MPSYDYKCTACTEIFTKRSTIARRKDPLSEPCPKCGSSGPIESLITTSNVVVDAVRLGRKPVDEGFNEVLARIHENTPGSNLGDKLSRSPHRWNG